MRYVHSVAAPVSALPLSESDKGQLQQWVTAFGTPQQVVLRGRILLAAAGRDPTTPSPRNCRPIARP